VSREVLDKQKALQIALTQIERSHGKGSIMRYGERPESAGIKVIPSGSLSLDLALGVWGYPRGRIVEIYGPEASGKTTLALHAVAEAQKQGGIAAYIDAEHAVDPTYTKNIGVDLDQLLISQPDTGEQALDIVETLVRSNALDVIVIDSVAALSPRAEIEGEMGDTFVGLQARMMSQAMRKLTAAISRSGTCVIFINQIREKVGVMFGPSEVTPGGRALKFYASVRVDVRRIASLKDGDRNVGNRVRARVVKNKLAAPFKEAEFEILFGQGISSVGDLLDLAVKHQIVAKSGAWYSFEGTRLGQGRENTRTFLAENDEVRRVIEAKVKEKIGHPDAVKDSADGTEKKKAAAKEK